MKITSTVAVLLTFRQISSSLRVIFILYLCNYKLFHSDELFQNKYPLRYIRVYWKCIVVAILEVFEAAFSDLNLRS
jgi:hypothetical protein